MTDPFPVLKSEATSVHDMIQTQTVVHSLSVPNHIWWKEGDTLILQYKAPINWVTNLVVMSVFISLTAYFTTPVIAIGILGLGLLGEILHWWVYNPAQKIIINSTQIVIYRHFKKEITPMNEVLYFKIFPGGNLAVSINSGAPGRLSAVTSDNQEIYFMIPPSMDEDCKDDVGFYAELKKFRELRIPVGMR